MRRHICSLLFLLGCGLFAGGCNSHATFDDTTCGKDLLDDGETCDNTPDGIQTANGKYSCLERALGAGTLKCTNGCQLDTYNCSELLN